MKNIHELLADCLREAPDSYVVDAVLAEFPTIHDLINASEDEIKLIKGIGAVKARQLKAILEFVRTVHSQATNKRVIVRSPEDVYNLMRGEMEFLQVEHFKVIGLSTKNHVIFKDTISIGSLNASIVHPREAFKPLIKRSCASSILVHNHPSGGTTPSAEDIALTKRLVEAGNLLDICVLDHIIIGHGSYVSLKEQGII